MEALDSLCELWIWKLGIPLNWPLAQNAGAMQLKGVELLQDLHNCCRIPPPNALIDLLEFTFACSTLQLNSFTNIQTCIQHPIGWPPSAGGWKPLIHHTLVCGCLMCRAFIPSLHKKSTCSSALTLQVSASVGEVPKGFLTKLSCFLSPQYHQPIPFEADADIDNFLCSLYSSGWVFSNIDLVYLAHTYF